jgi:hypothetical protein
MIYNILYFTRRYLEIIAVYIYSTVEDILLSKTDDEVGKKTSHTFWARDCYLYSHSSFFTAKFSCENELRCKSDSKLHKTFQK